MGLFTKDIKSMDDLFLHVMQDIYYSENQILKALPEMAAIWSESARFERMLEVELAVVRAQVARGQVPAAALVAIEAGARIDL